MHGDGEQRPPQERRTRRILAIGGGGFSEGSRDGGLEERIVELTGAQRPRVCLLPTASGDPELQISRFNLTFRRLGCTTSHVSLFRLGEHPLAVSEHLLEQDAIYVGGGSLVNLLAIWRAHGMDRILEQAWWRGILLCGVSAGSMCWFEAGITKSHGPPVPADGLGLLPGSNCVHHRQADRRAAFHAALLSERIPPGWGVDDGAALLFEGTEAAAAYAARPGARVVHAHAEGGEVVETVLSAGKLWAGEDPGRAADPGLDELRELRRLRGRR